MWRFVAIVVATAPMFVRAAAVDAACWDTDGGVAVHIDNDMLAGSQHDSDYTGGFALQITPRDQSGRALSHRTHDALDRVLRVPRGTCRRHAWQLGLVAMTPGTLRSSVPVLEDRPFASLLLLGSTATWNGEDARTAWQTTLELGALGLEAAESLHDAMHELVGDERPNGYQFQISEGGEATLRYVLARHRLRSEAVVRGETLQTKSTIALSAGYLTEASLAWSMRWGRVDSPWQSFTPELVGYLPTPMPLVITPGERELFGFAGARVKLRGYNALTQGQLRDSSHRLHAADLENWLAEFWAGVHWQPTAGWAITYTVRAHTPELRREPARRTLVWAGLSFSHRF